MRLILERAVRNGPALLDALASEVAGQAGAGRREPIINDLSNFATVAVRDYASPREEDVVGLAILGSATTPVVVAGVQPSRQLLSERGALWNGLLDVIHRAGVERPHDFALASEVLRLPSPVWFPHVTLAKGTTLERAMEWKPVRVLLGPL